MVVGRLMLELLYQTTICIRDKSPNWFSNEKNIKFQIYAQLDFNRKLLKGYDKVL